MARSFDTGQYGCGPSPEDAIHHLCRVLEDYFDLLRRLFRGETVSYDGPAGRYEGMRTVDPCPGKPPELWATSMGGPVATRLAARIADEVAAQCTTPDAKEGMSAFLEKRKAGWTV